MRYGTMIVDLERRSAVDILGDRSVAARWLAPPSCRYAETDADSPGSWQPKAPAANSLRPPGGAVNRRSETHSRKARYVLYGPHL